MTADLMKALVEADDALNMVERNRKAKPGQWQAAAKARENAAIALAVVDADAAFRITGMYYA